MFLIQGKAEKYPNPPHSTIRDFKQKYALEREYNRVAGPGKAFLNGLVLGSLPGVTLLYAYE